MTKQVFFLFSLFILSISVSLAQGKIAANVYDLKNNNGTCLACLFNSNNTFNDVDGQPIKCITANIRNYSSQLLFTNVPQGEYAIKVFHDENNNKQIDKNFLGIPKEGYGASMNKLRFAAAPCYHDNTFILNNDSIVTLKIKLRYL